MDHARNIQYFFNQYIASCTKLLKRIWLESVFHTKLILFDISPQLKFTQLPIKALHIYNVIA